MPHPAPASSPAGHSHLPPAQNCSDQSLTENGACSRARSGSPRHAACPGAAAWPRAHPRAQAGTAPGTARGCSGQCRGAAQPERDPSAEEKVRNRSLLLHLPHLTLNFTRL